MGTYERNREIEKKLIKDFYGDLAHAIHPLQLAEWDDSSWRQDDRRILSPNGKHLGTIEKCHSRYSFDGPNKKFSIHGDRIPGRSRWGNTRTVSKLETAVKLIKRYMYEDTDLQKAANEAAKARANADRRRDYSETRPEKLLSRAGLTRAHHVIFNEVDPDNEDFIDKLEAIERAKLWAKVYLRMKPILDQNYGKYRDLEIEADRALLAENEAREAAHS